MKILFYFLFFISSLLAQNKIYESKDIIIFEETPKLETIVFWCGIGYATPKWIESQIDKSYISKYNFILVSYNTSIDFVKKIYTEKTSKNLTPDIILGFSRGGLQAQKNYSPNYKIFGLIDPVLDAKLRFTSYKNIIITYNSNNWSYDYGKTLGYFGRMVARGGGIWTFELLDHKDFPKYFLKNFL